MELIKFINQHKDNWEELLAAPPYCLHIKHEDEYVLLKYDMALSDFSYKLCKEARGIIIRKVDGRWTVAAQGLDKFFNYNEMYSDLNKINWNKCIVSEKVDGTNIRIYMNDGYWHVSTLGCVNAFNANFTEGITFGDLVNEACGGTIENLTSQLDPLFCYYFELTGPNRIVINYGEKPFLWYLGRRNLFTLKENFDKVEFTGVTIHYPKTYSDLKSLQMCLNGAAAMNGNEEGYVIMSIDDDGEAHRIKIKGDEYLRLHKLRSNGILTVVRVISMWRDGTLDDYISAFPDHAEFINKIFSIIKNITNQMEEAYISISNLNLDRKTIALTTRAWLYPIPQYVFTRLDGKVSNANQFIEQMPTNKLASMIIPHLDRFSVGTAEDE